MAQQGKITGLIVPEGYLEKLDDLKERGLIRNRTDGLRSAIKLFYDYVIAYRSKIPDIGKICAYITGDPRITEDWNDLSENENVSIYRLNDMDFKIKKINENHVIITQHKNNQEIIINIEIREKND
ncbi:hypothetical protein Metho_2716 (plasmid) [Methanomethylovorans hollandica DSM 15978]|uniref:Uncharacterized protein n=1 Tax=Methanomethylovorans hollandica (strain DSM 15978 / NBRC 107637 / DMS1) TaxID=867904 RepID=L0L3F8_METHD|nr:hypothetical protein [Methanomethylovorans hollandica]AGB50844.1 hypothetical protein Metho_2716 [Methanomethylovorans hollandica DSM 15978]